MAAPLDVLRAQLAEKDPAFWEGLARCTRDTHAYTELLTLSTMRKRGVRAFGAASGAPLRVALIGANALQALGDLVEQMLLAAGFAASVFLGEYDSYEFEIRDADSALNQFQPQVVLILPSERRCRYSGPVTDPLGVVQPFAAAWADDLLGLCRTLHDRTGAEILLANLALPGGFSLGAYRAKAPGSDWSFRKLTNLALGFAAPAYVHICDVEFLCARRGLLASRDDRAWFQSKQPGSPELLVDLAKEVAHLVTSLRRAPAKVLVLDLDNTLWGGIIGDDGIEGIEIGTTSPRGEAFRAFQEYILSLKDRGVLLAVCSKNEDAAARGPFEKHPEMLLRLKDIVAFYANWQPKSENIKAIATELGLGLDSFVFVDDNPAEVEIVRQFVPAVTTILLGADPADYRRQLEDSRLFEPLQLTGEDARRTDQYRVESERRALQSDATDMPTYLASLEMNAVISPFTAVDIPRVSQLTNKSNQFNLTTVRRTESEIRALMESPAHRCFTVRLSDRFGDHGLVVVAIGRVDLTTTPTSFHIDTWLMSCRVLKRQVEEVTLNELFRLATEAGCEEVVGVYRPTAKNAMVAELLPNFQFAETSASADERRYRRSATSYVPTETKIHATRPSRENS
ncbi:MAG: HAD family hydrolase [Myxococcales bacterium]|nr:HAD family hydrolase [Myxococcales bacterium]